MELRSGQLCLLEQSDRMAHLCTHGAVDEDDLDARRAQCGLDKLIFVRRRVLDERLTDCLVECDNNEMVSYQK
jgi:hypothetical protein